MISKHWIFLLAWLPIIGSFGQGLTRPHPAYGRIITDGLTARYKLDDGSGVSFADALGNSSGAFTGSPVWQAGDPKLRWPNPGSIKLSGTGQYATVTSTPQVQLTNAAFSLCVRFKMTSGYSTGSGYQRICSKDAGVNKEYTMIFESSNGSLIWSANGTNLSTVTSNWTAGVWYSVIVTGDGTTARIYVNGALDNSISLGNPTGDATTLYFGSSIFVTQLLIGSLDEIRFYSRALRAAECAAIAQGSG